MEKGNSIPEEFDDIRPLLDSEVEETIEALLSDNKFRRAIEPVIKPLTWEQLSKAMRGCKTISEFQSKIIYPTVLNLIHKTTSELIGFNWEHFTNGKSHVVISNHRDIVLDAAFLNILFFEKKYIQKCSIQYDVAMIGDNDMALAIREMFPIKPNQF